MKPLNEIVIGDCREIMRVWSKQGVKIQTCVTSPPYFGLRDYGHPDQIGLEQTPDQYVAAMVEVFRCVRDVLTDDGTVWLNIGDSYADVGRSHERRAKDASGVVRPAALKKCERCGAEFQGGIGRRFCSSFCGGSDNSKRQQRKGGLKAKDLIGIPWRVAFALQADGWYLRQDIIWHKPNPMPESVRDRCTKAHEYIFLLSKSERYFFDSEAMREDSADPLGSAARYKSAFGGKKNEALLATDQVHTRPIGMREFDGKRNRRSVWTVATRPYKGAHFATFPPDLIEPCILAGSRVGDIVLDPFMGSGTTAFVAKSHQRNYLGCELNPSYVDLQHERLKELGLLF